MRCEQCRRNKFDYLRPYGGMSLCETCYERHNPTQTTVKKLDPVQRQRIENKLIELKEQINDYENRLKTDDKIIASGHDSLTFTSSYFHINK